METLLNKKKDVEHVRRIVVSYSDAPRNVILLKDIVDIAEKIGKVSVVSKQHDICAPPSGMNKISEKLNEIFVVIDD